MAKDFVVQTKDLSKTYQMEGVSVEAVKKANLEVKSGEYLAIVGPSGCGKSTLMHLLGLLDKPTSGEVLIEGQKVKNLSENDLAKLRNQKIGFVFQSFNLLDRTSTLDNVMLPLQYNSKIKRGERNSRAQKILAEVDLSDRTRNFPSQLSGGQQQKAAIARALACDPAIILADEPTGNLDSKSGDQIMSLFEFLNREGRTIIVVTHDPNIAKRTKRIVSMKDGEIVSDTKKDKK